MTEKQRQRAFTRIGYLFRLRKPVLPNDFREWGITSYGDARKFLKEFNKRAMKEGVRWIIEEKPFECRVVDPATGEECDGAVRAFYGQLDWAYRRSE